MVILEEIFCKNNIIIEIQLWNEDVDDPDEIYYNVITYDAKNSDDENWDLNNSILEEVAFSSLKEAVEYANKEMINKYN